MMSIWSSVQCEFWAFAHAKNLSFHKLLITGYHLRSVGSRFWEEDLQKQKLNWGKTLRISTCMGGNTCKAVQREKLGWHAVVREASASLSAIWDCPWDLSWTRASGSALYTSASISHLIWAAFRKKSWLLTRPRATLKAIILPAAGRMSACVVPPRRWIRWYLILITASFQISDCELSLLMLSQSASLKNNNNNSSIH